MGKELQVADVVRQIIVKAWTDEGWKEHLKTASAAPNGNVKDLLASEGFIFPKYGGYEEYPMIKVVECIPQNVTYIVIPPKPLNTTPPQQLEELKQRWADLGLAAGLGNALLGI